MVSIHQLYRCCLLGKGHLSERVASGLPKLIFLLALTSCPTGSLVFYAGSLPGWHRPDRRPEQQLPVLRYYTIDDDGSIRQLVAVVENRARRLSTLSSLHSHAGHFAKRNREHS